MNKGRFFVVLLSLIFTNSGFAYEPLPSGETKKIDINIEADKAAIESVWSSFQAALLANDISLAGQY